MGLVTWAAAGAAAVGACAEGDSADGPERYFWSTLMARMLVLPGRGRSSSSSLLSDKTGKPEAADC